MNVIYIKPATTFGSVAIAASAGIEVILKVVAVTISSNFIANTANVEVILIVVVVKPSAVVGGRVVIANTASAGVIVSVAAVVWIATNTSIGVAATAGAGVTLIVVGGVGGVVGVVGAVGVVGVGAGSAADVVLDLLQDLWLQSHVHGRQGEVVARVGAAVQTPGEHSHSLHSHTERLFITEHGSKFIP